MSAVVTFVTFALGLAVLGLIGPWLLQRSAPALMRVPRAAVMMVTGAALAWTAALIALGPLVAWAASGPVLLTGTAGEVCQRCLASANPFTTADASLALPAVVPLVLGVATALAVLTGVGVELYQRRRMSLAAARWLRVRATPAKVGGQRIAVVDDVTPYAWTLPQRYGGIVLSTGALDALTERELDAVLAHELGHLRQGHHVAAALMAGLRRTLGWVPFIGSTAQALPHYLEMAADSRSQRLVGTPALASALLALRQPAHGPGALSPHAASPVLHAVGPQRIGRLVGSAESRGGTWSVSLVAGFSVAYLLLGIATLVPYGIAIATGCA